MTSETQEAEKTQVQVTIEPTPTGGSITTISSNPEAGEDGWQQIRDQVLQILSELPDYIGSFVSNYQKPIVTVSLIVVALVSVKVLSAVIEALNDIPLLAPTFELIGLGYTVWFVNRYLLRASNRKELASDFETLKNQVLGNKPNL